MSNTMPCEKVLYLQGIQEYSFIIIHANCPGRD